MANSIKTISYQINASSFNTGIKNMKKNLQLFETELKNSAKEVVNSGKSIESLTKQHSSIRQALSQTNKMMEAYSDKIQENTKKLDSQKAKLKELDTARESARKTLEDTIEQYGKESEEAKKAEDALKKLDTQYKNMEKGIQQTTTAIQNNALEISKLEGKQQDLENQLKQTSQQLDLQGDKFIKASQKFSKVGEAMEKAGYKLKDMGEYAQKAGAIIVTASAGLAKLASGAEMGFAKVNTLAKDSGKSLQRFRDSVYDLSNNTGQNIEDLSNSIYNAISAGVSYTDSVKFMDEVNKVAVAGFGDINDAVSAMTSLMNIYGYTVDDVSGISDKLFLAQEKGVLTVGQLSGVLGESASTAKAYNVDLDNLLSGYVALTKAGINVEQSNSKMQSLFEELGDTGLTKWVA